MSKNNTKNNESEERVLSLNLKTKMNQLPFKDPIRKLVHNWEKLFPSFLNFITKNKFGARRDFNIECAAEKF